MDFDKIIIYANEYGKQFCRFQDILHGFGRSFGLLVHVSGFFHFNSVRLQPMWMWVRACVWVYLFVCICILRVGDVLVLNFAFTANIPEVRYTPATPPTTTTTATNYYTTVSDAMAVAEKASFQFDTDSVWLKFVSLQFLERNASSVVLCVRAHRRTIYRFHLTNVQKTGAHQRRLQWLRTQTYANIFVQRGAAKPIQHRTYYNFCACMRLFIQYYLLEICGMQTCRPYPVQPVCQSQRERWRWNKNQSKPSHSWQTFINAM